MTVNYLSPTSIKLWMDDPNAFYLKYLSNDPPPREPQTLAMAVGSAFDAYVKSYMVKELLGDRVGYGFEELFEAQVEPANRAEARVAGAECFSLYRDSGALADLMLELSGCDGEPRFETTVRGTVNCLGTDVPLLGKPDLYYISDGVPVVLDWKVNGFYSRASPCKGYIKCRDASGVATMHRECSLLRLGRVSYNACSTLRPEWRLQCCIYSWLLGCGVGTEFVVGIEQIVGPRASRCATLREKVDLGYQSWLVDVISRCWAAVLDPSWGTGLDNEAGKELRWLMK